MSAPAGALSIFPHYRSSVCSRRSAICISPLPQQCLLPQEPFLYSSTAAAVSAPAGAFSIFLHCRSSVCSRRSLFYIPPLPQEPVSPPPSQLYFLDSAEVPLPQAVSSIPSALSYANFGGFTGPLWLLSRDNSILGEHSGSGLHADLGPLSPVGGSTPGSGIITELRALSSDSTPNMHNPLLSLLYVSVNSWSDVLLTSFGRSTRR